MGLPNKNILNRITSDDPNQMLSWAYTIVANMTRKDVKTCEELEKWILKRLENPNPVTKKKTLKLITHLAENGSLQFAQSLARKTEVIKQWSSWRGQNDPLHGDKLNEQVRVAASQAIDAVFRSVENVRRNQETYEQVSESFNQPQGQGMFQGYFSGNQSTNQQGINFQGVSSGNYQSQTTMSESSFNSDMSSSGGMTGGKFQGYGNPSMESNMGSMSDKSSDTWKEWGLKKLTDWKKKSNKPYQMNPEDYPNFINQEYAKEQYQPPTSYGGYQNPRNDDSKVEKSNSGTSQWGIDQSQTQSTNDDSAGVYEAKVVNEFCSMTGVRIQPSRQEIQQFVSKCKGLSGDLIAENLDLKLKSSKWQVRLKALSAIEAFVKSNEDVKAYFQNNYDNVGSLTQAVQSSVSKKANSILNIVSNGETSNSSLLIEDETPQLVNNERAKNDDPLDLFGEQSNSSPGVDSTTSLFSQMNVKSPHEQERNNQPENDSDDIFSMISTSEEVQKKEETRQRSNSKRNILDTLDQLMGDDPVSQPQYSQSTIQQQPSHHTQYVYVPVMPGHHPPHQQYYQAPKPIIPKATQKLHNQPKKTSGFGFIDEPAKETEKSDAFSFINPRIADVFEKK